LLALVLFRKSSLAFSQKMCRLNQKATRLAGFGGQLPRSRLKFD
jgi:hypothetical protein